MKPQILDQLLRLKRLPTPSRITLRLIELADAPGCREFEIADVIAADPAISARILCCANSPLIGRGTEITSVRQAVVALGMRAVKMAVLSFSLADPEVLKMCPAFDFRLFWKHAAATAAATRELVCASNTDRKEEGFIAGLLSRSGKMALATVAPGEYQSALLAIGSVARCGVVEERAVFGTDHVEAGAALLAQWGLPSKLVRAVEFQLMPQAASDFNGRRLAEAIRRGQGIADMLCGMATGDCGLAAGRLERIRRHFGQLAPILTASIAESRRPDLIQDRARVLSEEFGLQA